MDMVERSDYWCCKADFGSHETTCVNYVASSSISDERAKIMNELIVISEELKAMIKRVDNVFWYLKNSNTP